MAATLPLCEECNNDFGVQLERPVSLIFEALEAGEGITDKEAELLVRWLWKFEGMFWSAENHTHPELLYSDRWTLKERVLGPSFARAARALDVGARKDQQQRRRSRVVATWHRLRHC